MKYSEEIRNYHVKMTKNIKCSAINEITIVNKMI